MPALADDTTTYMDTVVVTASKYEASIKEAPASISVITREEIDQLPATDITTALENVAGGTCR
ncbi:TonB-dependent receptor plug domain-containing protein [Vibrio sinaloensis]|nr:TonB-dependent receptor plug domain-containing protein [Vibrio sinaloensis]